MRWWGDRQIADQFELGGHLKDLIERQTFVLQRVAVLCIKFPYQLVERFAAQAELGGVEISVPLSGVSHVLLAGRDLATAALAPMRLARSRRPLSLKRIAHGVLHAKASERLVANRLVAGYTW